MTGNKWAGANDAESSSFYLATVLCEGVLARAVLCRKLSKPCVSIVSSLLNDTTRGTQSSMPKEPDYYGYQSDY